VAAIKQLENGRFRFYGGIKPPKKVKVGVENLGMADLPSTDREYLYNKADFEAWLSPAASLPAKGQFLRPMATRFRACSCLPPQRLASEFLPPVIPLAVGHGPSSGWWRTIPWLDTRLMNPLVIGRKCRKKQTREQALA